MNLYVSKSCVFCLVKNIFIQCIWRALDYEITYETQGHETWNCQPKNHITSTKFKHNLAMVSKTCLGSLDHTSLSLSKNQQKKRFKSCLQPLIKLGKTMQQPLHASKMKKIEKLRPLHKLKETLSKCSLCLRKCKLKNYVVTFAHLLNCTCYALTPI